ncbi:MAG: rhodanese-like domain-containing protein [Ideonella sp.]|nr:rhodanese-like domain-containing protein [Ideonella sp.]
MRQIQVTELAADCAALAEQRPMVLDVREDWEVRHAPMRLDGTEIVHIPMGHLVARLAELDPDRPVRCLCHHGMRSLQVAHFLERQGFADVANIQGGIDAWSAMVDPGVARY